MFSDDTDSCREGRETWHDHRPSWYSTFMSLAFVASSRSIDIHTQHGCIVVSKEKGILSTGYNGPPRGCDDSKIPLTRPDKYPLMVHAETNAIANAARHGTSLNCSTFFITGHPCSDCTKCMINVGAKKIIYGPVGSHCVDAENEKIVQQMLEGQEIEFVAFSKMNEVVDILENQLERVKAILSILEA